MFGKIIFLFVGLFVQELITLNALIFATHQGLYSPIFIHSLFLIGTIVDIIIGFYIGKYLNKKKLPPKIGKFIHNLSEYFLATNRKYERWFAFLVLGNISFPYINAFIAGYLDLPFWESSLFNFIGNILYYISLWLLMLGVHSIFKNIYVAFGVAIATVFVILIIFKKIRKV